MQRFLIVPGLVVVVSLLLPPAVRADDNKPDAPAYTDVCNGGTDEVEYVLEKVTRKGREVTLTLKATLTKGPEKRTMQYYSVAAVDADGNEHKSRINANPSGRSRPQEVNLRAGIKTKIEIKFPLAAGVTSLQTLEVTSSAVERVTIKFADVSVPK